MISSFMRSERSRKLPDPCPLSVLECVHPGKITAGECRGLDAIQVTEARVSRVDLMLEFHRWVIPARIPAHKLDVHSEREREFARRFWFSLADHEVWILWGYCGECQTFYWMRPATAR